MPPAVRGWVAGDGGTVAALVVVLTVGGFAVLEVALAAAVGFLALVLAVVVGGEPSTGAQAVAVSDISKQVQIALAVPRQRRYFGEVKGKFLVTR